MFSWNLIFYGNPLIASFNDEGFMKGIYFGTIYTYCFHYLFQEISEEDAREGIQFTYDNVVQMGDYDSINYVKDFRFSYDNGDPEGYEECNRLLPHFKD